VEGYPSALRQLFRQLTGNSLKFRQEGRPPRIYIGCARIPGSELDLADARPDTEYYQFKFGDNGIGFDPTYSERIFGMFQRIHGEGQYKGSGMGLPIARKIAEIHGGFLSAESIPGEGSTFYCYLPVAA
jgi:hypothetical protein